MSNNTYQSLNLPPVGFGTFDTVAQQVKDSGGQPLAPDPEREAQQVETLLSAIDLGYRHFDTAEMYGAGNSEEVLGRALAGKERDDFIITSKVMADNLGYQDLLDACARSLDRLETDYLDLYLIHWPSPDIPLEESFRALNQLVREGKIRHVGVSNFDLDLLKRAVNLCETPIATNQVFYNLVLKTPASNGVLAYCQENGITLSAYAPLRGGFLNNEILLEVAGRLNATPAQVAINWLVRQPGVITIPHSSNRLRQQQNLEAASLVLSDDDVERLNGIIHENFVYM